MSQEASSTVIEHHSNNVFIVRPPAGILEQPHQEEAVKAFLGEVTAAASKHRDEHQESAVMVIDMSQNPTMNSSALAYLSDTAKRMSFDNHKVVLANSPMLLSRLLSKMDHEKSPLESSKEAAAVVAEQRATEPAPKVEPKDAAKEPVAATTEQPAPLPPPPKPDWTVETNGNAIIITPPEGTKLTEESHGKEFVEKIVELLPDPANLPHDAQPRLIFNLKNVAALSGDAVGNLMQLPKKLKERGMPFTIANLGEDKTGPLKTMRIIGMFNLSDKPVSELVESANQKSGANLS